MREADRRANLFSLGVLVLATLIVAISAGRRVFWSSDEARVALLAQDVLEHGRWSVAELRGRPYLNKPQLFFWTVAASSWPFGRVTELSAAIPSIVSSLAGVAGVIAVGRLLWGWKAGVLAGLILATTPFHFEMSHQVLPDTMLNAWLVWAFYWIVRAERSGWPIGPVLAFHGCVTGALLTKGPPALAAIAAAMVAVGFTDGVAGLRKLRLVSGIAGMLSVATIVWLAPYHLHSGGAYTEQVISGHYVTWYLLGSFLARVRALLGPLAAFLPWTLLLIAAPVWWRQAPDPARRRVVLWTATLWVLTAVSGNSRARYMLPVFPGLALLVAELVTAGVTEHARRALARALALCAVFAGAAAVVVLSPLTGMIVHEDRAFIPQGGWETAMIVLLALSACLALIRSVRRDALTRGAIGLALAVAGILLVEGVTYPGRYTRDFDVRPLTAAATLHLPGCGTAIGHPDLRLSYDFYLNRRVIEIADEADVRHRLGTASRDVFIMTAERWSSLAPAHLQWRSLASAQLRDKHMVVVGQVAR